LTSMIDVTILTGRTLQQGIGLEVGKVSEEYSKSVNYAEISKTRLRSNWIYRWISGRGHNSKRKSCAPWADIRDPFSRIDICTLWSLDKPGNRA
jgi:hypothetical protein